jgi:hypothetical protein
MIAAGALLLGCAATPPVAPGSPSASGLPVPTSTTVHPITAAELGATWRPGCPVEPGQLRRVDVNHIGFDNQIHRGELVVHKDVVSQVITIFEQLYRLRYPINKIRTVDHYPGAADEVSMEDNNTSAFNCRNLPGTNRPSQHSYGRAIDLNPLLNPAIDSTGAFQPKNASAYLDRSRRTDPGLLHGGDAAVRVFTDRGWGWGGYWTNPVDYQHFELP